MREIKFRAWDKKSRTMIYDYGVDTDWGRCLLNDLFKGDQYDSDTTAEPVFMQYTGLKDKNGVEIYEGDIVKDGWHKSAIDGPVHFASYGDGEYIESIQCWMIGEFTPLQDSLGNEVLGNIYENPELLKNG